MANRRHTGVRNLPRNAVKPGLVIFYVFFISHRRRTATASPDAPGRLPAVPGVP